MKRRALLVAGGAWLAAARLFAQAPMLPRRIAYLHPGTEAGGSAIFEAFRIELRKLGYIEGRDVSIETRWAEGNIERLTTLAAEVVARNPAVIVTSGSAGVAACKSATSTIPIVFATAVIPVEQGFVSSLRRPGGNITGVTLHLDVEAKRVEIIREALPEAKRLGILVHEPDPIHKVILESTEPAARRFKFQLVVVRVREPRISSAPLRSWPPARSMHCRYPLLLFSSTIANRSSSAREAHACRSSAPTINWSKTRQPSRPASRRAGSLNWSST